MSGAQVTTTRVGASPKSARSGRLWAPVTAAAAPRSTSAPSQRPERPGRGASGSTVWAPPLEPLKTQHSASATASPPSAQSWALLSSRASMAQPGLELHLELQVHVGHAALDPAVGDLLVLGAVHPSSLDQHDDHVALVLEGVVEVDAHVGVDAQHADHRRGVDRLAEALVVEAHVAAHDRRVEGLAGLSDALH